jgi:transposase
LHRAGELTPVWVPDAAQEALRDLTRARGDMKHMQRQAKQRLLGFLLRHGKRYHGKTKWTREHARWLQSVKFEYPAQQIVFQEYADLVARLGKLVAGLDAQIQSAGRESVYWPLIQGLMALRGIDVLSATIIVVEVGDLKRFESAGQLMAYLGLVPSEHSSGARQSRGGITKTGNAHVRRVLVEAAWSYHHPARKTAFIQRRAKHAPEVVQDIAWKAQKRLCARFRLLETKGKLRVQACTAVARELTGFIWAIGQTMPSPQTRL